MPKNQPFGGTHAFHHNVDDGKEILLLQQLEQLARQRESLWNVWRLPLIQTRSEWVADTMIDLFVPAAAAAENAMERANAQYDLLRLRIALERYQFAEGAYPQELERLVPAYLEEVPLDLPTGRKSWVYKSSPDEETAYLLHSAVWDSTGKDQYKKELFARKELYERKKK